MEIAGTGIFAGIITTIVGGIIPSIIAGRTDILRALKPYMGSSAQKRLHLYLIAGGIPLLITGIYLRTQYIPEQSSGFLVGFISFPLMIGGLILITAGIIRTAGRIIEYTLYPLLKKNSKIASRNLGRNLVRTTISFTLIAMTLSFVVSTGGIQGSVDAGIKQTVTDLFESDIIIISGGDPLEREFWKRLIKLENGTLIDKAAPVKIIGTKLQSLTRTQNVSVPLTAIHTKNGAYSDRYCAYDDVINMKFTPETPPDVYQKLHNLNTIIISSDTAETLEAEVGSRVRVLSLLPVEIAPGVIIWKNVWRTFTIIGIVAQGADISGWGTSSSFGSNEMCYISYHTLNLQWGYYEDEASTFYVKVKPEFENNIGYARDIILNNYGKRFGIGVITRIDILDAVKDRIDQTSQLFELVVLFSVFIAAIGMSGIMVMNIQERKREIGVFRSQGMSRKQVVTMIAGEAIIIGSIGLILGTISGLLFYWGVTIAMNTVGFKVPVIIPYNAIQTASLLAIGVSISSTIYPIYKANKLTIIDALRGQ
jgi:ABC-type antimicrobial peptide transport system permease subunit